MWRTAMLVWVTVKGGAAIPVDMTDGEIVHHLKEKIKQRKENVLKHVDADELDIYESKAQFDADPRPQAPHCVRLVSHVYCVCVC